MKFDRDKLKQQLEDDIIESKRIVDAFMKHELLDEDGYPTDEALQIVEAWHWTDPKGWFDFIKEIWHLKNWGWGEGEEPHEWSGKLDQYKDKMIYQYDISTAGWSGNESIIRSMQKNEMMWHLNWVQSRRGGHYIFELKEFKDEGIH
jgi:hypothetical protein